MSRPSTFSKKYFSFSNNFFTASPSSLPSLYHSSPSSSSSSSLLDVPLALHRPNQHLAVLLPKHLWKVCFLSIPILIIFYLSIIARFLFIYMRQFILSCAVLPLRTPTCMSYNYLQTPSICSLEILALSQVWRSFLCPMLFTLHAYA